MKRREFLKVSVLASAAVAGTPLPSVAGDEKPRVRRYQEIGKTGLKMSDISRHPLCQPAAVAFLVPGALPARGAPRRGLHPLTAQDPEGRRQVH